MENVLNMVTFGFPFPEMLVGFFLAFHCENLVAFLEKKAIKVQVAP